MAKAKPLVLNGKTFRTKSDANNFFKEMLKKYIDGETVSQSDDDYLYELLCLHPDAQSKIGCGVDFFYVDRSDTHPTGCFHIKRIDGSKTDFSYPKCTSGKDHTLEQKFYQACRMAVSPKLIDEKERFFEDGGCPVCPKTGEVLERHNSEYRHTSPRFIDIVKSFISHNGLVLGESLIECGGDLNYAVQLSDPAMKESFISYHQKVAKLGLFRK